MAEVLPPSYCKNTDSMIGRFNPDLERFTTSLAQKLQGVDRAFIFYQTCRQDSCKAHELILGVNPRMWHRPEDIEPFSSDIDFPLFYPSLAALRAFSRAFPQELGMKHVVVDLIAPDKGIGLPITTTPIVTFNSDYDGSVLEAVHAEEFMNFLWNIHCAHLDSHHGGFRPAGINPHLEIGGWSQWVSLWAAGKARINSCFRTVKGVAHTDTDLLLVDTHGRPILLVEEYHPSEKVKSIDFSMSLSKQAGGGLVAKVRTDGNPRGPHIQEVWDTQTGQKLVWRSKNMRGYEELEKIVLEHPANQALVLRS